MNTYVMNNCAIATQSSCIVLDPSLTCLLSTTLPAPSLKNQTPEYLAGMLCCMITTIYNSNPPNARTAFNPYKAGTIESNNWLAGYDNANTGQYYLRQYYKPLLYSQPVTLVASLQYINATTATLSRSLGASIQQLMYISFDLDVSNFVDGDLIVATLDNSILFQMTQCSFSINKDDGSSLTGTFNTDTTEIVIEMYHILSTSSSGRSYKMVSFTQKTISPSTIVQTHVLPYYSETRWAGSTISLRYTPKDKVKPIQPWMKTSICGAPQKSGSPKVGVYSMSCLQFA